MRARFKEKGMQRKFIQDVLERINCPSLREVINRGVNIPYSTLKNYYNEERLIPLELFEDLIELSRLNKGDFDFEILQDHWGQILGGRNSRK